MINAKKTLQITNKTKSTVCFECEGDYTTMIESYVASCLIVYPNFPSTLEVGPGNFDNLLATAISNGVGLIFLHK